MNDAKILSLDEIKALEKGNVIWRVELMEDDESGYAYYILEPTLVCVPGSNGILSWANNSSFLVLNIDDNLLNGRSFWNKKPDDDMIPGVSESAFDRFINETPIDDFNFPQKMFLNAITLSGFTVSSFCELVNISGADFVKYLQSETIECDFVLHVLLKLLEVCKHG